MRLGRAVLSVAVAARGSGGCGRGPGRRRRRRRARGLGLDDVPEAAHALAVDVARLGVVGEGVEGLAAGRHLVLAVGAHDDGERGHAGRACGRGVPVGEQRRPGGGARAGAGDVGRRLVRPVVEGPALGVDQDGPQRRVGGLVVTPGSVDIHTHYDGQATWDPEVTPSSWHGVTTVVMGNCGVGFAPVRPGGESFLIELMEGVEDIPGTALHEGIEWAWSSFPEYLDALEATPRAVDVAAQVPHA